MKNKNSTQRRLGKKSEKKEHEIKFENSRANMDKKMNVFKPYRKTPPKKLRDIVNLTAAVAVQEDKKKTERAEAEPQQTQDNGNS